MVLPLFSFFEWKEIAVNGTCFVKKNAERNSEMMGTNNQRYCRLYSFFERKEIAVNGTGFETTFKIESWLDTDRKLSQKTLFP